MRGSGFLLLGRIPLFSKGLHTVIGRKSTLSITISTLSISVTHRKIDRNAFGTISVGFAK